jgi:hypothetical protein
MLLQQYGSDATPLLVHVFFGFTESNRADTELADGESATMGKVTDTVKVTSTYGSQ